MSGERLAKLMTPLARLRTPQYPYQGRVTLPATWAPQARCWLLQGCSLTLTHVVGSPMGAKAGKTQEEDGENERNNQQC